MFYDKVQLHGFIVTGNSMEKPCKIIQLVMRILFLMVGNLIILYSQQGKDI